MLQSAIDKTAGARVPLMLGPGDYRVGGLTLPSGTQLIGVRGATRLIFTGGSALIAARAADHVTLGGPRARRRRPAAAGERRARRCSTQCNDLRIMDCEVTGSGRGGIRLDGRAGRGVGHHRRQDRGRRDLLARCARADRSRTTPCAAPATAASWCIARRRATTARWSSTTASRTSPMSPAAPASTATPSTCSAPAMSSCAATASAAPPIRRCAAMPPPTSRSPATPRPTWARSRSIRSSASRAR